MPRLSQNILLNFKLKNEASRANLNENRRIFNWRPFWKNVNITNFLLTEREGRTGEYWPEVVAVRTERSEVRTKTTEGQYSPVRLELARLVSSLLYGFLITFCFVFASP